MNIAKGTIARHLQALSDVELDELKNSEMTREGREALAEELSRRQSADYQEHRKLQDSRYRLYEEETEKLGRLNSRAWEIAATATFMVEFLIIVVGVLLLIFDGQIYVGLVFLLIGGIGALLSFAVAPPSFFPLDRLLIFLVTRAVLRRQVEPFPPEDTALDEKKVGELTEKFARMDEVELKEIAQGRAFGGWTQEAVIAARKVLEKRV